MNLSADEHKELTNYLLEKLKGVGITDRVEGIKKKALKKALLKHEAQETDDDEEHESPEFQKLEEEMGTEQHEEKAKRLMRLRKGK